MTTFSSITFHLFSVGWRHATAVADILRLIKSLEELHTKVQGLITYPYLSTTTIYKVLRRWIMYLNRCVDEYMSEALGAPEDTATFNLEPILLDLEGGSYVGTILTGALEDIITGQCGGGGVSGDAGQSGNKASASGGGGGGGCGCVMTRT